MRSRFPSSLALALAVGLLIIAPSLVAAETDLDRHWLVGPVTAVHNEITYFELGGSTEDLTFDRYGNLTKYCSVGPFTETTTRTVSPDGRVLESLWVMEFEGATRSMTTTYQYDSEGRLVEELSSAGDKILHSSRKDGNTLEELQTDGLGNPQVKTVTVYSPEGKVARQLSYRFSAAGIPYLYSALQYGPNGVPVLEEWYKEDGTLRDRIRVEWSNRDSHGNFLVAEHTYVTKGGKDVTLPAWTLKRTITYCE